MGQQMLHGVMALALWPRRRMLAPRGRLPPLPAVLQITGSNPRRGTAGGGSSSLPKLLARHQLTPEEFKQR